MTENKKLDLLYGALFGAVFCSGCAVVDAVLGRGSGAPGGNPPPAIGILQTIAALCGQPWAIPILGAIGGTVSCATNAHHGVRNVAVGAARMVAKPFTKKKSKK